MQSSGGNAAVLLFEQDCTFKTGFKETGLLLLLTFLCLSFCHSHAVEWFLYFLFLQSS